MNITRADQLGSGVRNLYFYTDLYSGGTPELIEGDIFKTIIPLRRIIKEKSLESNTKDKRQKQATIKTILLIFWNVMVNPHRRI